MSAGWLALVLCGLPIGLSLGLIGGGGSILAVPALVYVAGQDAHAATATSLVVVGLTAGVGALPHWRAGRVDLGTALPFALAGIPGSFLGAIVNRRLPNAVVLVLFSLLMLVTAARMFQSARSAQLTGDASSRLIQPGSQTKRSQLAALAAGFGVGALTGLFGAGGGFIIVPALVLFLGFSMRMAVGTSLAIIALNAIAALLVHLHFGGLDLRVAGLFAVSALAGVLVGARLSERVGERWLRLAFAGLVAALGVALLSTALLAV